MIFARLAAHDVDRNPLVLEVQQGAYQFEFVTVSGIDIAVYFHCAGYRD
jgi:hypothetical protein